MKFLYSIILILVYINLIYSIDNENIIKYYNGYAIISNVSIENISKIKALETSWSVMGHEKFKKVHFDQINSTSVNITIDDDIVYKGLIRISNSSAQVDLHWNPVIISSISTIPTEGGTITVKGHYLDIIHDSPNELILGDRHFRDQTNSSKINRFYYTFPNEVVPNKDVNLTLKIRDEPFNFIFTFLNPNISNIYIVNNSFVIYGSSFGANLDWLNISIGDLQLKETSFIAKHTQIITRLDTPEIQSNLKYGTYPLMLKVDQLEAKPFNVTIKPTIKDVKINIESNIKGGSIEFLGLFLDIKNSNIVSLSINDINCLVDTSLSVNNGTSLVATIPPFIAGKNNVDNGSLVYNSTTILLNIDGHNLRFNYGKLSVPTPIILNITRQEPEIILDGLNLKSSNVSLEIRVGKRLCNVTRYNDQSIRFIPPHNDKVLESLDVTINGFKISYPNSTLVSNKERGAGGSLFYDDKSKLIIIVPIVVGVIIGIVGLSVWRYKVKQRQYLRVGDIEMKHKFTKFVIDDTNNNSSDDENNFSINDPL